MAGVHRAVLGILVLQMYVHGAPSDVSKLEDIAKFEPPDVITEVSQEENKMDNARQKRYYNPYGFGFPPFNPIIYPNYDKRDQSSNTGTYGYEDPFVNIHRRLQEIANVVRQPAPTPPPPHIPIFLPVIFIPQPGCQCFPETATNPPEIPPADTTKPNQTTPDVFNRFPEMDDERQNWGLVVNDTADDDYDDSDGSRPISFDPIRVNRTMVKAPPPVEHGTVQSDSQQPVTSTPATPAANSGSFAASALPQAPSNCDGAVLSCCHQLTVTYNCFAVQGCPDPTSYGNPCDPNVILKVIDKFQQYYGQKNQY